MRVACVCAVIVTNLWAVPASAQSMRPAANTVAVGGNVGFLAPDNGPADGPQALQATTGSADVFVEYYYTPRVSLRAMYGWASPQFEAAPDQSLRRQHVNVNALVNWDLGRLRPFAGVGGGTYFLSRHEAGRRAGSSVTKPGGVLGWGAEYLLRTFALRSEMNVHILGEEKRLPGFDGKTLTAFTWTFGMKVAF